MEFEVGSMVDTVGQGFPKAVKIVVSAIYVYSSNTFTINGLLFLRNTTAVILRIVCFTIVCIRNKIVLGDTGLRKSPNSANFELRLVTLPIRPLAKRSFEAFSPYKARNFAHFSGGYDRLLF